MKKFLSAVLLLTVMTLQFIAAQWSQTSGPKGGNISSITQSGQTLFATTWDGGIYRSTNNGAAWAQANTGLTTMNIYSFISTDSGCFAGTQSGSGGGIFRSMDNGDTWKKISTTANVIAFARYDTLLFAGTYTGVYRSTDYGATWTAANNGLTNTTVYSLVVMDSTIFVGTANGGVFRSTNGGTKWAAVNTGLTNKYANTLYVADTILYAGTNGGVFRSTDRGGNWTVKKSGLTNLTVKSISRIDTILFAGTYNGIFRSSDGGATWNAASAGLPDNSTIYTMTATADGKKLYAGTSINGIFLSTDNGTTWTGSSDGLVNTTVTALAAGGGSNLFAGTTWQGIFFSSNGGDSWSEVNSGLTNLAVNTVVVSGESVFAGTSGGGVFSSTNNGTTWNAVNSGLTNLYPNKLAVVDTNIFATTSTGVFRFSLNNLTWNQVSAVSSIPIAVSGTDIFIGTSGSGIFRSTDRGTGWAPANSGLLETYISTLGVSEDGKTLYCGATGNHVYNSLDNGDHWSEVGYPNAPWISCFAFSGDVIFAGTSNSGDVGIYVSMDGGATWPRQSSGLPFSYVMSLAVNGNTLYAATMSGGVWKRPISELLTSVNSRRDGTPEQFTLSQNYPNPFNPSTTIHYSVAVQQNIVLKVYDFLGREVCTLVNELRSPGTYEVEFDAHRLSSGIYFYQLRSGTFVETKRMMLVK